MEELLSEVHLLGPEGTVLRGGEAVRKIISLVPQSRPLRWMVTSRWGHRGAGFLYRTLQTLRRCPRCPPLARRRP